MHKQSRSMMRVCGGRRRHSSVWCPPELFGALFLFFSFFFFSFFFQCAYCCCLATYCSSLYGRCWRREAKTCIKGILPLWRVASHTACMYGSMLMRISVDVSFIVISLCTLQLFLPLNYVQEREMPLFPMSTRPSQRHRHAFFFPFFPSDSLEPSLKRSTSTMKSHT